LHNVTSALCNRKHVKDVIDEAIMGTCIALRVPMPEKKGKGKGKNARKDQEEQPDDVQKSPTKKKPEPKLDEVTESDAENSGESWAGFGSDADNETRNLADSDAEEKAFSRFDDMLGGSSEDEDGASSGDEDAKDSRARSIRGPSDYFSGSSAEENLDDEEGDLSDGAEVSEGSAVSSPPKKAKSKAAKPVVTASGNSTFLPSLMGGYISGSESEASDIDIAPPAKKNRRGQRARQAIWEKKFKKEANHVKRQNEKSARDQGWDMKKGAVGEEEAGPWKKGIVNPFEKKSAPEGVHPDRQANFNRGHDRLEERAAKKFQKDRGANGFQRERSGGGFPQERAPSYVDKDQSKPAPKPKPKKDNEGPLHASWQAAKEAKEAAQNVKFQGKKITFD
jgi:hypothetical protein